MTATKTETVPCTYRCGWEWPNDGTGERRRDQHEHLRHDVPLPPQPVTGTGWQEQAVDAVRQVAARGQDFTLHAALVEFGVGDPPNAKTALGRFAVLVHDMQAAHPVGYDQSQRTGTKRSAVAVWNRDPRRCNDPRCRRKAGV